MDNEDWPFSIAYLANHTLGRRIIANIKPLSGTRIFGDVQSPNVEA